MIGLPTAVSEVIAANQLKNFNKFMAWGYKEFSDSKKFAEIGRAYETNLINNQQFAAIIARHQAVMKQELARQTAERKKQGLPTEEQVIIRTTTEQLLKDQQYAFDQQMAAIRPTMLEEFTAAWSSGSSLSILQIIGIGVVGLIGLSFLLRK